MDATEPLWIPDDERVAEANLTAFIRAAAETRHLTLGDYTDLHTWSLEDPAGFWLEVWDQFGVVGDPGDRIVETATRMADVQFFPDARLNFAENLLRREDDSLAMMFRGESGVERDITWAGLNDLVSRLQQAMLAADVAPGDRVASWLPNMIETYAVMLAAASIGAVFSSSSPDFGVDGVLDRFGQIEPVLLFATDAYAYGGSNHDCLERLDVIVEGLPTVRAVVLVPYLAASVDVTGTPRAVSLDSFISPFAPVPVTFVRLPFDHPLYVLYSSGTTGAPKCIVHRAGGILLKHLVEHRLHCDVRPGDRMFYFTTAGWMMWNWLASGLASEATLVLYDGSPFEPDSRRLFDLIDDVGVTLFGISAKFIDAVAKAGLEPGLTHDLATIRTICSTGSPLTPEGFEFVYRSIGADLHLASISGGTDLCGCLVAGDPTAPVWPGEIQRPGLGMAIDVVDREGTQLPDGVAGELVCGAPFPSMPIGFWDDPDGTRYDEAYFTEIPGFWHQGDFAERTEHGGLIIHGRSDATLNPGGVRIGTAEIYRQVEQLDEVVESLVIGQNVGADTRVVLFVVLRAGVELDEDLEKRIRSKIRSGASPRHVPAVIAEVAEMPRTRSGKLVELAVRDVVHGREVKNRNALANPETLEVFVDHPALR